MHGPFGVIDNKTHIRVLATCVFDRQRSVVIRKRSSVDLDDFVNVQNLKRIRVIRVKSSIQIFLRDQKYIFDWYTEDDRVVLVVYRGKEYTSKNRVLVCGCILKRRKAKRKGVRVFINPSIYSNKSPLLGIDYSGFKKPPSSLLRLLCCSTIDGKGHKIIIGHLGRHLGVRVVKYTVVSSIDACDSGYRSARGWADKTPYKRMRKR